MIGTVVVPPMPKFALGIGIGLFLYRTSSIPFTISKVSFSSQKTLGEVS